MSVRINYGKNNYVIVKIYGPGNVSGKVSVGDMSSGKSINRELTTWELVQIPFVLQLLKQKLNKFLIVIIMIMTCSCLITEIKRCWADIDET